MSARLLDGVRAFIRRFVVLDDHQADAVTLWAAATHVFEAFACTPYLSVSSAERRSGKTQLLGGSAVVGAEETSRFALRCVVGIGRTFVAVI